MTSTAVQNLVEIRPWGASGQIGEILTIFRFLFILLFLSNAPTDQSVHHIFTLKRRFPAWRKARNARHASTLLACVAWNFNATHTKRTHRSASVAARLTRPLHPWYGALDSICRLPDERTTRTDGRSSWFTKRTVTVAEITHLTFFKMAHVRHLEFLKVWFFSPHGKIAERAIYFTLSNFFLFIFFNDF